MGWVIAVNVGDLALEELCKEIIAVLAREINREIVFIEFLRIRTKIFNEC